MKRVFYRGRFIFIPIAVAAFLSLASLVVMQLWNILMPVIFHLVTITFWQAMGLIILSKILFGIGKGGRGFGGRGPWMRHKMEERFRNMTPEQREKFKQHWSDRCGHHGRHFGDWDNYAHEPAANTVKPTE